MSDVDHRDEDVDDGSWQERLRRWRATEAEIELVGSGLDQELARPDALTPPGILANYSYRQHARVVAAARRVWMRIRRAEAVAVRLDG